jgi:DNA-binding MarR family transcriptional regulator
MAPATVATDASLGTDLLNVVARLNRLASQQASLAFPHAQVRLLAQIEERGPSRISELAAGDNCSQPTMTAQVQRLEARGWVARVTDPGDARAVLISITDDGAATLDTARAARGAVIARRLAALDPTERATLADAVPILRRLHAAAPTPSPEE